jgi:DNA primase catalytic core
MARIPESEIARLKTEVSLVRLVEAAGIALKKQGKDYVGNCPFHADATPSLIVTPEKNLFHCFGCDAAGGPIDWLMKFARLSFRAAVERLRSELGISDTPPPNASMTTQKLKATALPLAADADAQTDMRQVLDYYHETLKQSPEALNYLQTRGLVHPELIVRFRLGFANRTLGYRLPMKAWKSGQELRGRLQAIGLLRESGHEHFNGSIVIPVIDKNGVIHEIYGRKIRDDLRTGTAYHLYLPGEHKGVWNEEGIQAAHGEIILCEALIDALTFWVHGFRNVTASYGVNGFTEAHLHAFKQYEVKRVLIAYDRDEAGNVAADKLAQKLMAEGIECFRVLFPKNMDANEYAQKVQPAEKSLGLLLQQAQWIGKGVQESEIRHQGTEKAKKPAQNVASMPAQHSTPKAVEKLAVSAPETTAIPDSASAPNLPSLAAMASVELAPTPAMPAVPTEPLIEQTTKGELLLTLGDRHWRIRGWQKNLAPEQMRVNAQVRREGSDKAEAAYYVDTLDVYSAKQRAAYIKQGAVELAVPDETIKRDLGKVLLKLEALQDAAISAALAPKNVTPSISDEDQAAALALLKSPDLTRRVVEDMERCGVVGEATNLLAGYLAAVSRKLNAPLAVLIQSSSAAGKSSLMDAVLNMMPKEERIQYSAMTGQSLFYLGENDLQHKILAIAEEEGVRQAAYALKLLQSDGELTMASTGKDDTTGNLVTKQYRVQGPVMLMLTTTAIDVDEELLNRCLVLTVNESREQTQAIHARQRAKQTLEGLLQENDKHHITALHHNAQRLLKTVQVVNPYAHRLSFLDDKTRMRRDHMKYLTLINAIALLHQYQRPLHTIDKRGQKIDYIEVSKDDIALANKIAHDILGRTLDELPPQTRRLLTLLQSWVAERCTQLNMQRDEFRFTRKEVRDITRWGDTQLKLYFAKLVELEYLIAHSYGRRQACTYELMYDGKGDEQPHLMGLLDTAKLDAETSEEMNTAYNAEHNAEPETKLNYDAQWSDKNSEWSGSGRGAVGMRSGYGRMGEGESQQGLAADLPEFVQKTRIQRNAQENSQASSLAAVVEV